MDIVRTTEERFPSLFGQLIRKTANVSWAYLPRFAEYQRLYAAGVLKEDCSFIFVQDGTPVCYCPLFLEEKGGERSLTYNQSYLRAPIFDDTLDRKFQRKLRSRCFEEIDAVARTHSAAKAMLLVDPLAERADFNYLSEYGFIDASIATVIVDLTKSDAELWGELRKSYQSLINGGKRTYEIRIMDASAADFEFHEQYRQLHHKAAGRVTRDRRTYDLQFEMLKDDNAILVGVKDPAKGAFVAFSYYFHHNGAVYYASSSDDPEYEATVPLEHTIIWGAVEYYKKRGFRRFEIGWQQFGTQLLDPANKKDLSISFFKRGFGGMVVALYRGVKYYDKGLLLRDLSAVQTRLAAGEA